VQNLPFPTGTITGPYHCSAAALASDYIIRTDVTVEITLAYTLINRGLEMAKPFCQLTYTYMVNIAKIKHERTNQYCFDGTPVINVVNGVSRSHKTANIFFSFDSVV